MHHSFVSRLAGSRPMAFACQIFTLCLYLLAQPQAIAQAESSAIVVVDDKAYPPFAFLTPDGTPRGITIDIWKLWSQKTGIPVEFRLMIWQDALDAVSNGRADAIGGMFKTPERVTNFDFVVPIHQISTAIFYDETITGIRGLEDLAGFKIACVNGDSAEELLRNTPSQPTIVSYKDLASLIQAAVTGQIKIFMADVPSVRFYLSQQTGGDRFRQSPDITSSMQYVGIRKGQDALAHKIREGFLHISGDELDTIFQNWTGKPVLLETYRRELGLALATILIIILTGYAWNITLRRKIRIATHSLEQQNIELQKIQEEIQHSEEKFRLIFENAPYAIAINRLSDGMLIDANAAFLKDQFLDNKKEVLGQRSNEYAPLVKNNSSEITQLLLEHKNVRNIEAQVIMKNGSCRSIIYSSVLMENKGEPLVLSMVVDVTERVKAETALRLSEEKFRMIFDHIPIGIYRVTMAGEIVDLNPTLIRMLGYEDVEHFPQENRHLIPMIYSSQDQREPILQTILNSPKGARIELEIPRKDGSTFPAVIDASVEYDAEGKPAFINGTVEDQARIRQAESDLRRLAAAVEQSSAITIITGIDGRIEYVNKAFEHCTGYSRHEVLGRYPSILKSGKHDLLFYQQLWETILGGRSWHGRFFNRKKNGDELIEDATIFPIFDDDGKVLNFVAVKRDITRELTLEAQHRQMQKMEAIGQLTGGVAHDFNNLLQVIQGYTELGLISLEKTHDGRGYLEEISKAALRAGKLVQQLLLFSRQKIMQPKIMNLNDSVNDLLKMLGRLIGENIQITWLPCDPPPILFADSSMIDQVLLNLCVNARDAMPAGGMLTIESSITVIDEEFCKAHAWASPGQFALLQVSDNGSGMNAQTRERIFEPFFTTKAEGKGTGMGLATVYGIVRQHNGMIDVYSEPGHGSRFRVFLPLYESDKQESSQPESKDVQGGSETILLAEDDDNVRKFAITILQLAGYKLLVASDGQEAVELFRQNHQVIDLLILDVVMPRLGGKDSYNQMKVIRPGVPVLYTSGYSKNAIHTNYILDQGVNLLQKPYSRQDLLQMIRDLLNKNSAIT